VSVMIVFMEIAMAFFLSSHLFVMLVDYVKTA